MTFPLEPDSLLFPDKTLLPGIAVPVLPDPALVPDPGRILHGGKSALAYGEETYNSYEYGGIE